MNAQDAGDPAEWGALLPTASDLHDLGCRVALPSKSRDQFLTREGGGSAGQLTVVGVRKLERSGAELRRLVVDEWKVRSKRMAAGRCQRGMGSVHLSKSAPMAADLAAAAAGAAAVLC